MNKKKRMTACLPVKCVMRNQLASQFYDISTWLRMNIIGYVFKQAYVYMYR